MSYHTRRIRKSYKRRNIREVAWSIKM